jgi:hypothetical protein
VEDCAFAKRHRLRYVGGMTVDELKAAAAKLQPDERVTFADWLSADREVQEARRERLRREIQKGLDQIERGEYIECKDEAELHAFFEQIRARGRARLASQQQQPAA